MNQRLRVLDRLRLLAPVQCRRHLEAALAAPHPAEEGRDLADVLERCTPLSPVGGFAFPVLARGEARRVIVGGVLAAASVGEEATDQRYAPARSLLEGAEALVSHLERRASARGQRLCVTPFLPPAEDLSVGGDSVLAREADVELSRVFRTRRALGVSPEESWTRVVAAPSLEATLAVGVENDRAPARSFQARLSIEVEFDAGRLDALLRDGRWRAVEPARFATRFSKIDLSILRSWASDLLWWPDEGAPAPVVLTADMTDLAGARLCDHEPAVRLTQIDLVPLCRSATPGVGPRRAAIGLVFDGEACSVGQLLEFVASRTGLLELSLVHRTFGEAHHQEVFRFYEGHGVIQSR